MLIHPTRIGHLADAKCASMLCHNPDDGCELTTTAQLLEMGIPAATGACIEKFIHPHVEDELQQVPRVN